MGIVFIILFNFFCILFFFLHFAAVNFFLWLLGFLFLMLGNFIFLFFLLLFAFEQEIPRSLDIEIEFLVLHLLFFAKSKNPIFDIFHKLSVLVLFLEHLFVSTEKDHHKIAIEICLSICG